MLQELLELRMSWWQRPLRKKKKRKEEKKRKGMGWECVTIKVRKATWQSDKVWSLHDILESQLLLITSDGARQTDSTSSLKSDTVQLASMANRTTERPMFPLHSPPPIPSSPYILHKFIQDKMVNLEKKKKKGTQVTL